MSVTTLRFVVTAILSFILSFLLLTKILNIESSFSLQDIENIYQNDLAIEHLNGKEEVKEEADKHSQKDVDFFKKLAPIYEVPNVDCKGILEGDKKVLSESTNLAKTADWNTGFRFQEDDIIKECADCQNFVQSHGFVMRALGGRGAAFPLAFALVVYKHAEPVTRLLRAVYRPGNLYCIHVDSKADDNFYKAMESLTGCLPGVFLTEKRQDVKWGEFSVLAAELQCMQELLARGRDVDWRYYINLTGQEFPLKPVEEMVEILEAYEGANDVEGTRTLGSLQASRARWTRHPGAPASLSLTKGSVHALLSRDFVDFCLNSREAKALLDWLRPQKAPEETFFSTINHNPHLGAHGSFVGLDDVEMIEDRKPWFARYKSWKGGDLPCAGRRRRDVCILSTGDLPRLHKSKAFIANKFFLEEDRMAYGCMEQRLFNMTRDLQLSRRMVDTERYANSMMVRYRLKKEIDYRPRSKTSICEERNRNQGMHATCKKIKRK